MQPQLAPLRTGSGCPVVFHSFRKDVKKSESSVGLRSGRRCGRRGQKNVCLSPTDPYSGMLTTGSTARPAWGCVLGTLSAVGLGPVFPGTTALAVAGFHVSPGQWGEFQENKFLGFGVQKLLQFSELAASLLPSPAQAFASKLTASGWPRSAGSSSSSRNWSARCVAAGGGWGWALLPASCAGLGVPLVSLCYKLPAVNDGFVKRRAHAWSP